MMEWGERKWRETFHPQQPLLLLSKSSQSVGRISQREYPVYSNTSRELFSEGKCKLGRIVKWKSEKVNCKWWVEWRLEGESSMPPSSMLHVLWENSNFPFPIVVGSSASYTSSTFIDLYLSFMHAWPLFLFSFVLAQVPTTDPKEI